MRWRSIVFVPIVLLFSTVLHAARIPVPPSPTEWVTDTANFLSPAVAGSLNARLSAYQQATGHQLLVYIAPTTGDDPIEDWAVRAFQQWKVGRKGLDDGLVLFIMSQDHKMRIEVGYGLEAVVPDVIASRILNEVVSPRIRQSHTDDAVTAGIDALTAAIGGQAGANPPAPQPQPEPDKPISMIQWVSIIIGGILFLILLITHPGLALFFLANIMSGGGGGGGRYGGGGGFSGGGGRSGGGGANGSW